MSLKGKTFTVEDMSAAHLHSIQQEANGDAEAIAAAISAWATEQTERYRIVAVDEDTGTDIIAEELAQRVLNRLSPKGRRVAGMMMRLDPAFRTEILAAFSAEGILNVPFKTIAKPLPAEEPTEAAKA